MMRVSFLIRKINGSRLPSEVQRRARSIAPAIAHDKIKDEDKGESQHVRPFEDIPGPKPLPLIGNTVRFLPYIGEYNGEDQVLQLLKLREKYGDIVKLEGIMNRRPCVFLFTPELAERMYRVQGLWPTRIAMESLHYYRINREEIYDGQYGLATSQGKTWHDFRTKVNQLMMQPRMIRPHITQINEVTDEFVEKMRALRDPDTLELPSDFNNELFKWALEAISSIGLNCRLGCLKPNLAADSEPQIMINCVHDMFDLMFRLELRPSLWKLYNTRNLKKFFRTLDTLNRIASKHIERTKAELDGSTASADEREPSILEKLLHIDEQTARVMVLDMVTAGVDTTGNTGGALLYNIAINPERQERLREEVMSVLPDKSSRITPEILNRTTYTKACIKESLRLFAIAIGTLRTMQTDVTIGGYRIPKGCDVIACHSAISLDPEQFARPQEFIPERWLRGNADNSLLAKNAHPFAYMPFGFGARTCIGRRLAELELETLLLTILRKFRIEWHHEPMKFKSQFINVVASPLRLKLVDL